LILALPILVAADCGTGPDLFYCFEGSDAVGAEELRMGSGRRVRVVDFVVDVEGTTVTPNSIGLAVELELTAELQATSLRVDTNFTGDDRTSWTLVKGHPADGYGRLYLDEHVEGADVILPLQRSVTFTLPDDTITGVTILVSSSVFVDVPCRESGFATLSQTAD
jgi:hypothetical protein